jgi:hypothetical protein
MTDLPFSFTFVVRQKGGIHQGFHRRFSGGGCEGISARRGLALSFDPVAQLDFFQCWISMLSL